MTPRQRKLGLIAHITASIGWFGAVAAFSVLNIAGLTSHDIDVVRGAYFAMNLVGSYVIVPLSLASLATGLLQALGTEWGLLRHTWIFAKLLLTTFATIILLVKLPLMSHAARLAAEATVADAELGAVGLQLAVHAIGGLLTLLIITTLSVFKPWGKTGFGRQKQRTGSEGTSSVRISSIGVTEHRGLCEVPVPASSEHSERDFSPPEAGLSLRLKILLAAICIITTGLVILHLTDGGFGNHGH